MHKSVYFGVILGGFRVNWAYFGLFQAKISEMVGILVEKEVKKWCIFSVSEGIYLTET